jgi:hypothetical protein
MTFIGGHLNNCPLPAAKPTEGVYFRLLPSGGLSDDDFKSRAKLCEECKDYLDVDINICGEHAVSLCTSMEDANKVRRKYKKRYHSAKVAEVRIQKSHGPVDKDRPGHANWWHPTDLNPLTIASLTGEDDT